MVRVWVAGVTHGPYLSDLEIGHNKTLCKFILYTFTFYLLYRKVQKALRYLETFRRRSPV